ncbi:MAG: ribonuclease P protein component [Anaerolineaceae bacterium]|nr:ribonuclease P protein component [Anaerolineaceae bacterium]
MDRKNRLNNSLDIQRVRRSGKSIGHPLFVLLFTGDKNVTNAPVGVIASKAVGGAVERNRAKRVLRSAATLLHENIRPDCMILLIARKAILDHDTPEVTEILADQLKKAGIYRETSQE